MVNKVLDPIPYDLLQQASSELFHTDAEVCLLHATIDVISALEKEYWECSVCGNKFSPFMEYVIDPASESPECINCYNQDGEDE